MKNREYESAAVSTASLMLKCTKCEKKDFEDGYDGFSAHILVCGGDGWDETEGGKKSGKKGKRGKRDARVLTSEERGEMPAMTMSFVPCVNLRVIVSERVLESRRARFARFEQPSLGMTRTTRFQIAMVQKVEEEEQKNKNKIKKGGKKGGGKKKAAPVAGTSNKRKTKPVVDNSDASEGPVSVVKKIIAADSNRSRRDSESPLPDRPRRSTVNYARDRSLRHPADGVWQLKQEQEIESMLTKEESTAEEAIADDTAAVVNEEKEETANEKTGVYEEKEKKEVISRTTLKSRRRASCSLLNGGGQAKASRRNRLSLDSRASVAETRKATQKAIENKVQPDVEENAENESAPVKASPTKAKIAKLDTATVAPAPVEVEQKERATTKEEMADFDDDDDAPLIRLKLPSTSPRRKKARDGPLKKPLIETASRPVKRRRSTLDDINGGTSSNLIPSPRKRRISSATAMCVSSFEVNRSVFPVEVKLCALDRIAKGDTHTAVARDLQCPTSTVASWWYRRSSLLGKNMNGGSGDGTKPGSSAADNMNSSGEDSPDSQVRSKLFTLFTYSCDFLTRVTTTLVQSYDAVLIYILGERFLFLKLVISVARIVFSRGRQQQQQDVRSHSLRAQRHLGEDAPEGGGRLQRERGRIGRGRRETRQSGSCCRTEGKGCRQAVCSAAAALRVSNIDRLGWPLHDPRQLRR
jgi:hypothetical protein